MASQIALSQATLSSLSLTTRSPSLRQSTRQLVAVDRIGAQQRRTAVVQVSAAQSKAKGKSTPAANKAPGPVVFRTDDPLAGRDYRPPMPGDEKDLWEGPQWDVLGFVLEYLWVFGLVLAVVSSIYAVNNYGAEVNRAQEALQAGNVGVEAESGSAFEGDAFLDDAPPL
eukprot:TRINITY_DN11244_c0_g1_i1.p3 TRINITY_DN11244_c0_g1~~TRINITY_DN11244_c0_g1_i1.p3  ORF type:complete len:169 (-),score=1.72 TRINITY_DN11244_c0_g1_i1:976-1482(-)